MELKKRDFPFVVRNRVWIFGTIFLSGLVFAAIMLSGDNRSPCAKAPITISSMPQGKGQLIFKKMGSASTELRFTGASSNYPLSSEEVIYESSNIKWVIWDVSKYNDEKVKIDSIINESERAVPAIGQRLGYTGRLPILAHIDEESGGAWAVGGGAEVGYSYDAFTGDLQWIKGVVIGELLNTIMGALTDNWPSDWWCDGVWYFPGMVSIDVAKEIVDSAFALKWENDERYPTYPVYNVMYGLLEEFGWKYWQDFFNLIKDDNMKWRNIGTQPSQIRTDYVIAYMSLAAGRELGPMLNDSLIKGRNTSYNGADTTEVKTIEKVRDLLVRATSQGLNVNTAWQKYRSGDYAGALAILDTLPVPIRPDVSGSPLLFKPEYQGSVSLYSLQGQKLFTGMPWELPAAIAKAGQPVVARYGVDGKFIYVKKLPIAP